MPLKISQLPHISTGVKTGDLIELSQRSGDSFVSSNATIQDIADCINSYFGIQIGTVSSSLFSEIPLICEVTLPIPYTSSNYIITVTGESLRLWTIINKTPSSFTISSNSNVPFYGSVYWRTYRLQ